MSAYETARERLEHAHQIHPSDQGTPGSCLEHALTTAEAEWAAAQRDLRRYETKPGIPLPQYRQEVQA